MEQSPKEYEFLEFPSERTRRLRGALMAAFADQETYRDGVQTLRRRVAIEGDQVVDALVAFVFGTLRLVDRRDKKKVSGWAVRWVLNDVLAQTERAVLANDPKPPPGQFTNAPDQNDGQPSRRRIRKLHTPTIEKHIEGAEPAFTIYVSATMAGIIEIHGDFAGSGGPDNPEPPITFDLDPHDLFDSGLTDEAWERLRAESIAALDAGLAYLKQQVVTQTGATRRRRKSHDTDAIALQMLCEYLLDPAGTPLDAKGPTSCKKLQTLARELGLKWPRSPARIGN